MVGYYNSFRRPIYRATVDEFSLASSTWTFEQVGAVENGISAAEWSPDNSILVLITGVNRRILLTRDFEPIEEGPVQVEGFGSEEMISIGWERRKLNFMELWVKLLPLPLHKLKWTELKGIREMRKFPGELMEIILQFQF